MNTQQFLSPQQIISAAQTMPLPDLEKLVDEVLSVQATRRAPHLSADESRLMRIVSQTLSESDLTRMRELQTLRDDEQLQSDGYVELAALIDHLEELHAERMRALGELANLRGVTLFEAMKQVGLNLPDYE